MLQIQRMIEKQNPASGCWEIDRLEDVGPQFEKGESLYNYVKAVMPSADWWNMQVSDTSGDLNEYGIAAEREVTDLSEWMEKWERMTGNAFATEFSVGDPVMFRCRGKNRYGTITSIHLDKELPFAVITLYTKAGRISSRLASRRFVALSALRCA